MRYSSFDIRSELDEREEFVPRIASSCAPHLFKQRKERPAFWEIDPMSLKSHESLDRDIWPQKPKMFLEFHACKPFGVAH
jgi:hypothetical protein